VTSPILVAEAPQGTPATRVPARTRNDLDAVAIVAPLGSRAHHDLPLDLLAEMGKRNDVTGKAKHTQDNAALATVWLRAHGTSWVVVTSPHAMPVTALQFLATLVLPAGARLLLACDHGTAGQILDGLADWGAAATSWDAIASLVPQPDPIQQDKKDEPEQDWTAASLTLPREDWPVFRSECRRLLSPRTFTEIDSVYQKAFRATRNWLRANDPTEESVAALLSTVLAQSDLDRTVTALRGCQAAHMAAGWLLRVDLDKAVAALSQRPVSMTDAQWRSLRAYLDPNRAAIVVLHEHGLTITQMLGLTLADTAPDGSRAGAIAVDPRGHDYIKALWLHRHSDGAQDTDPLIEHEQVRIVAIMKNARNDLSLHMGSGRLYKDEHTADRWQRRLGLQLRDLR